LAKTSIVVAICQWIVTSGLSLRRRRCQHGAMSGAPPPAEEEPVDAETIDAVPVLAEVTTIERVSAGPLPAIQVAAVAATSFVAGAATVALLRRHVRREIARQVFEPGPPGSTRTFLVNVRVIPRSPD
jgi:hypothetical protein